MLGMSNESPPITRPRRRLPRVPAFYPVPVRQMHNGWSPQRQAHFLGWLAETGSVSAACARVGMSRNSAYNLRKKPDAESFAAAWDAALGMPIRKVTVSDLEFLAYHGLVKPRFRGGKYIGSRPKPSASALLRLLARYDRVIERTGRTG
jgi:molybdenum-dependent DNA-binding transcriptional regulator ModE